jgi:hypothetical protein
MSTSKVFSLALAAGLLVATVAVGTSSAAPVRGRRVYAYQPRAAASAQARVQSNRRYSYSPAQSFGRTYSSPSYDGGTLGLRNDYRPGPGYSPRQGINSAAYKIQGL